MSDAAESAPSPVALVTGGAIRVGAAITRALLEAGYGVWVHHHRSTASAQQMAQEHGGILGTITADLLQASERRQLCARVMDTAGPAGGRLDLVVHNAASFEHGRFEDRTDDDLQRVLTLNLLAPLSLTRLLLGPLRGANPAGSVVHVLDLSAVSPWPGRLDHSVAKAGLGTATRVLAAELAPIRVNAVAPGTVLPPEGADPDVGRIPRRAIGSARDVAEAILFLARAPHVSGHTLVVDGGETAAAPPRYG